jgi:hypothetical protein
MQGEADRTAIPLHRWPILYSDIRTLIFFLRHSPHPLLGLPLNTIEIILTGAAPQLDSTTIFWGYLQLPNRRHASRSRLIHLPVGLLCTSREFDMNRSGGLAESSQYTYGCLDMDRG